MARKHVVTMGSSKDGARLLKLMETLYLGKGVKSLWIEMNKQNVWEVRCAPEDAKVVRAFAARTGNPLAAAQPIEAPKAPKKEKAPKAKAPKKLARKANRPVGGRVLNRIVQSDDDDEQVVIIRPKKKAGKAA